MDFLDIKTVKPFPGIMVEGPAKEGIARYQELAQLFPKTKGVSSIPVGRQNSEGDIEIACHCDVLANFQTLAEQDSEFQHIPVILGNYTDEEMVRIYQLTHPVLTPVEALVEQGQILESHRSLENTSLSRFVRTLRSIGPFSRQYANSLIGLAQSPSWFHEAIETYPRLKSLPSKLLPLACYKDFTEAFWSCLNDSFCADAEGLSKVTIRQFNQLLAFFKALLRNGQEQEACCLLATSSLGDLVEQLTFLPAASPAPSATSNDLEDDIVSEKSILEEEVYRLYGLSYAQQITKCQHIKQRN